MIGSLTGRVQYAIEDQVIVDVGGVGYRVTVPASTRSALPPKGETVFLWIHTHVREQGMSLFGFATRDELDLFRELLNVSGVGPRLALTALSTYAPKTFRRIVAEADRRALTRIPGVGKKTADRLLFELKGKLQPSEGEDAAGTTAGGGAWADALEALINLGYAHQEASAALQAVAAARPELKETDVADGATTSAPDLAAELIRTALRELAATRRG